MSVPFYRLAYNIFHRNWIKFGIPEDDIPPTKFEVAPELDLVIPRFSVPVALFQIACRKNLVNCLDGECPVVHNYGDFYTRFTIIMREALPKIVETLNESVCNDSTKEIRESDGTEELPQGTMKKYRLEDTSYEVDAMKEGSPDDVKREDLSEIPLLESLSSSMIFPDEVSGLIAYSLAICTELILYEYKRKNKDIEYYMKKIPDLWGEYFDENLKPFCEEHISINNLLAYCEGIKCPEKYLNAFLIENKEEYTNIAEKFYTYTANRFAKESPEHGKLLPKRKSIFKGVSFLKMKEKFMEFKNLFKCGYDGGLTPLLLTPDSSSSSSISSST